MRLISLVPVILFGTVAGAFALGLKLDPRTLPSMLADHSLPDFDLPAMAGGRGGLRATDLKGKKITVLNVFASWCGGCRYEHPTLMTIAGDSRVDVVGMNWKDDPVKAAEFITHHGNPYRTIGEDPSGRTGIDLGVTGVPETFVIDHQGRVRYHHAGPLTPELWRTSIEPVIATIESRS